MTVKTSRVRIAVVLTPALVIGVLVGGWLGSGLFAGPNAAGPPASLTERGSVASAATSIGPGATVTAPPPSGSPAAADPGVSPAAQGPGNPTGGGGNPPPATTAGPPPTTAGPPPPPPAWESQINVSIQVNGNGQTLGFAQGWAQFATADNAFRYSFTVCRQSSFIQPYMRLFVNGSVYTTLYPSYGGNASGSPCYGSTGTLDGEYTPGSLQSVEFELYGSTFINGNQHQEYDQDRILYH